jgi:amino acid transporter
MTPRGPYHPRAAGARHRGRKLRVPDATAMAVGGMIGGGIFSVLGVAITLAGHLAFACFMLGGVLAAATARSWAGVTARSTRSGGPFDEVRRQGHPQLAGLLLWLLVFGYMVAMAVYSFTFGRYAANALHAGTTVARLLSIGVIAGFLAVNMRGVRLSSLTEDLVVLTKLVILFGIATVGIFHFDAGRLSPLVTNGVGGVFLGASTVFFAYEGFELICYDRGDMEDPERTLPRSLYLSVAIVALVYVSVTVGSQMLVSDQAIVANKEAAFVAVGRAALGGVGRWAAILGALLATGSAINATLFSTARLVRDASASGELPPSLGRETGGLPIVAMTVIAAAGGAMAMLPGITAVITFGSGSFLAVYAIVNYLDARTAPRRSERITAWLATGACTAAFADLVAELARHDRPGLLVLVGLVLAIAAGRIMFARRHPTPVEPPA